MEKFRFQRLSIPDVIIAIPSKSTDHRGYVMESYSMRDYVQGGISTIFVQDNHTVSYRRGVVRGLHFQIPPHAQAKLVRVVAGAVFDVALDLRLGAPTYGQWCAAILTADGAEQMFIPKGFAHGFCTLAPDTIITYKLDAYFSPESATGVLWSSLSLAIDWPLDGIDPIISAKDESLVDFADFHSPFTFDGAS